MPFISNKQRAFAHSPAGKAKGFPTEEFDKEESKGKPFSKGKGKPKGKKRPVRFSKPFGKSDDKY